MDPKTPHDIYVQVDAEVDGILKALVRPARDGRLSQANASAQALFDELGGEVRESIAALHRNAEWETFTIAFYGETNAGKSTIIEMLRMLLDEPGKAASRRQFKAWQAQHDLSESGLQARRQAEVQASQREMAARGRLDDAVTGFAARRAALEAEQSSLLQWIEERKAAAPSWRRWWYRLVPLPEQKRLPALEGALVALSRESTAVVAPLRADLDAAAGEHAATIAAVHAVEALMAQLAPHADGAIIGNGDPDFTLATQPYHCAADGQSFVLLDVPGIEGKEVKVLDSIRDAVQKAHAVFYVTGKAAPPQTGDGSRQGTLEKIADHLGAQTEVWAIFNKRIKNPIQLDTERLVKDEEETSLLELDKRMGEQLGAHYRGHVAVSAQPAFLALADCLVPGSRLALDKAKFESRLPPRQILARSGVEQFRRLLVEELLPDHKGKIARSNFHKANGVIGKTRQQIKAILHAQLEPLASSLAQEAAQTIEQLDLAVGALKRKVTARGGRAVDQFATTVRQRIYQRIEDDIDNDDFESAFKRYLRQEQAELAEKIGTGVESDVAHFQEDVGGIIERFEEHASELADAYGKLRVEGLDRQFTLKIDIASGVDMIGLASALAGGLLMIWNPAGWAILAAGAVTVLIGVAKAVWGLIKPGYRMSQQRKAVDENLATIEDDLLSAVRGSLDAAMGEIGPAIATLKEAVDAAAGQTAGLVDILQEADKRLGALSAVVEPMGKR